MIVNVEKIKKGPIPVAVGTIPGRMYYADRQEVAWVELIENDQGYAHFAINPSEEIEILMSPCEKIGVTCAPYSDTSTAFLYMMQEIRKNLVGPVTAGIYSAIKFKDQVNIIMHGQEQGLVLPPKNLGSDRQ